MKFNVGDLLIDKFQAGNDPARNSVVVDIVEVYGESSYYTLQYSNGEVNDFDQQIAEFVWQKAPKGSVAWLIHQLSALPQLAPVKIPLWSELHKSYGLDLIETVKYSDNWERVELW